MFISVSCIRDSSCSHATKRDSKYHVLSWSIFRSMFANRSFMAFNVDASSWSDGPSAVRRLALVGVFGIDMSDLVRNFDRGTGICVCMPRSADSTRCCRLLEYCQWLLNVCSSS